MRKLTTALGMPQHRFASIHVVGTNGKSSVTRMIAALLEAHGLSAGACVSPHAARWAERTLIHGEEIGAPSSAAAVERVAQAAEVVNRTLEEGEAVTQFEAATAAGLRRPRRGPGGGGGDRGGAGGAARRDQHDPLAGHRADLGRPRPHRVAGGDRAEIAAEKLAVLRDHSTLVLGRVSPAVAALAERVAARTRGARYLRAPEDPGRGASTSRAPGPFQRRNFALALAAARPSSASSTRSGSPRSPRP